MVLKRRNLPAPGQEDIAYELGAVLPPSERFLLRRSHRAGKPLSGLGTRINLEEYSLTKFFKERNYPLSETYCKASRFRSESSLISFMSSTADSGADLLVCFNLNAFTGERGVCGHACLVESVDGKNVILCDPALPARIEISAGLLLRAMKEHYLGGVWIVSEKSRKLRAENR
jgi:hypothetical protein